MWGSEDHAATGDNSFRCRLCGNSDNGFDFAISISMTINRIGCCDAKEEYQSSGAKRADGHNVAQGLSQGGFTSSTLPLGKILPATELLLKLSVDKN